MLSNPSLSASADRDRDAGAEASTPPGAVAGPWLAVCELNHRIANEYAAAIARLSIAAARLADPDARAALAEAASRLRDFAEAHRALQPPLAAGPVGLADYLRRLCAAVTHARLAARAIELRLVEHDVELEARQCWQVGLIVAELINNAVRHAFGETGGTIVVELGVRSGEVLCAVIDNGRASADPPAGQGTRIVDALAAELGGAVERRFSEHGTMAILTFRPRQVRDRPRCGEPDAAGRSGREAAPRHPDPDAAHAKQPSA